MVQLSGTGLVEPSDVEIASVGSSPAVGSGDLAPESPLWWARLLLRRLEDRRMRLLLYQAYYDGEHPLEFMGGKFREAFGHRFQHFASNFAGLVVDGEAERLEVQGFRFRDEQGDKDLWDIWQDNDMDGWSQVAHAEALVKESVYALVDPVVDGQPRITVEDALDCVVVSDPRDRRVRLAGLKRWTDEAGRLVVYLYLPDEVYTFRSERKVGDDWMTRVTGDHIAEVLQPYQLDGEAWPMVNPLGVVPLVEIVNRPDIKGIGRSDIRPVTSQQDAINYYRAAALVAARKVALPQRWIKNYPIEIDKDTGRPKQPFAASDDLWMFGPPGEDEPVPTFDTDVGQFPAADLSVFVRFIEAEVWQMAAVSRMPYGELLPQPTAIPQSAEAMKSSEGPLLRKIGRASIHLGEGWEEVMRVCLIAMGDDRATNRTAETIWVSAETRNEAVRTDSLVKQIGVEIVDIEEAQVEAGYTPQQIERMGQRRQAREALQASQTPVVPPPIAVPESMPPAPTGPRMSPAPTSLQSTR